MNKKKNNNNVAICIKVSEDLRKNLNKEANNLGIATSDYIRLILLNRNKIVIFGGSDDRNT